MLDRLEQIETRYEDLGRQLADPQLVTDHKIPQDRQGAS